MAKDTQIRTIAQAVIQRVLQERKGSDELAHAVDQAYPFGLRQGRAYEIWRDEARRALHSHASRQGAAA